jgi:membrane-associated phospholipid phosphatase
MKSKNSNGPGTFTTLVRAGVWLLVAASVARGPVWAQSTACPDVYPTTVDSNGSAAFEDDASAATNSQQDAGSAAPQKKHWNPLEGARDPIYHPGDTERLKPLGRKLLANVLLDQKEIWTSPFHMHAKDAKWWLGFGAITGALMATDHRTINTFENSPGQIAWGNRLSKIGAEYTVVSLVAGLYTYGALKHDAKAREAGVLGGEALLDSVIVVSVLKTVTGRNRPDANKPGHDPGHFFDSGSSFPSGHAIESWSLASLIAHEYGGRSKLVPVIAYGLASVVSLSRFAAQRHYASDILAGSAIGWFIGRYVYQKHEDPALHLTGWMRPRISPQFEPVIRTYGVTLAFGN